MKEKNSKAMILKNLVPISKCDDAEIYKDLCKDGIERPTYLEFKKICGNYSRYISKLYYLKNDDRIFWIEYESVILKEISIKPELLIEPYQQMTIFEIKEARQNAKRGEWIKNLMICPEDLRSALLAECYERKILDGYSIIKECLEKCPELIAEMTWEEISKMIDGLSTEAAKDLSLHRRNAKAPEFQIRYRQYIENQIDDQIQYPQDGKNLKLFALRSKGDPERPWLWSQTCSKCFMSLSDKKTGHEILSIKMPIRKILMFLNNGECMIDPDSIQLDQINSVLIPELEECMNDKMKILVHDLLQSIGDALLERRFKRNEISELFIRGFIAALLMRDGFPDSEKEVFMSITGRIEITKLNELQKSIIHDAELLYENALRFSYVDKDYKYMRSYLSFIAVNQLMDSIDSKNAIDIEQKPFLFNF